MKDASPAARFWAEFRESKVAVIALAVVVMMIGIALVEALALIGFVLALIYG